MFSCLLEFLISEEKKTRQCFILCFIHGPLLKLLITKTVLVKDTTIRCDIHRGTKQNTRQQLTLEELCAGWCNVLLLKARLDHNTKGWSFFYWPQNKRDTPYECDMTSQRQSVGFSFSPFTSHEMPPSFRLQKKKNVCNPVKGFGERVSREVWEIHWTRDSTSSSDTEYCLQSSDPTWTPSAVSKYMSLSPRPCVDTPNVPGNWRCFLKTPNIKIFST